MEPGHPLIQTAAGLRRCLPFASGVLLILSVALAGCDDGDITVLPEALGATPSVALFADSGFVDYAVGVNSAEASNVEAAMVAAGVPVLVFTGITDTDFAAALAGRNVLVIPEIEFGDLNAELTVTAKLQITNFVSSGGTLLMLNSNVNLSVILLNGLFGYGATHMNASGSITQTGAASGTPFDGAPPVLPNLSATGAIVPGSEPPGLQAIYTDITGGATVLVLPIGGGHVVMLGWDWFDAAPVGTQDGGWLEVLGRATVGYLF